MGTSWFIWRHLTTIEDKWCQLTWFIVNWHSSWNFIRQFLSSIDVNRPDVSVMTFYVHFRRFGRFTSIHVVFWRFSNLQKFWKKFWRFSSKNDDKWLCRHFFLTSIDVKWRQLTSIGVKWCQLTWICVDFCIITKNFASNH